MTYRVLIRDIVEAMYIARSKTENKYQPELYYTICFQTYGLRRRIRLVQQR